MLYIKLSDANSAKIEAVQIKTKVSIFKKKKLSRAYVRNSYGN